MKIWIRNFLTAPVIFAFIALISGVIFIKIIPPLWGIDEITHFARAYQIAGGEMRESKVGAQYGGYLPQNLVALNNYVYKDLTDNTTNNKQAEKVSIYKRIESQRPSAAKKPYIFPGSGAYSPLAYAPSSLGILIARALHSSLGTIIFWARFLTLLIYTLLVSISLWLLNKYRIKWLIFIAALIPMCIFQASIVNVDSLAIGLSMLLFSLLLKVSEPRRLKASYLVLLFLVAIILSLTKPNYWILLLPIVFVPKIPSIKWFNLPVRIAALALSSIPFIIWNLSVKKVANAATSLQAPSADHIRKAEQLSYLIEHPIRFINAAFHSGLDDNWLNQMIGLLGWNYVAVPSVIAMIVFSALLIACLYTSDSKSEKRSKAFAVVMLLGGLVTALSIILIFYITYSPVGSDKVSGVQGRYFIPLLIFILYGFGRLLPIRVQMSEKIAALLFPIVAIVTLISSVAIYYSVTY